jgi:phosphoserine phosphatase RsbU/P
MHTALETPALHSKLRSQLLDRRERLEATIARLERPADLVRLLTEVDSALSRLEGKNYGMCQVCLLPVGQEDLLANPMAAYCLCELTPERQRALERDLDLAWHVQSALLPPLGLTAAGWHTHYRYVPQGPVSGDYCDLVVSGAGAGLYFMLGDVSGKGVAASLLMAHLNALFRSLAHDGTSPETVMNRANRALAESTLASHYATLVCGCAHTSGEVEIVNAGHCHPFVIRSSGSLEILKQTGLPLGLAVAGDGVLYSSQRTELLEGDALVLYTDGLTEAANAANEDYGTDRLVASLHRSPAVAPQELVANCLSDLAAFLGGADLSDDLTVLVLARQSA